MSHVTRLGKDKIGKEKRRATRIDVSFMAEWDTGHFFAPAEIADISPHGVFLSTARPANQGQLIQIRLYIPDGGEAIECYGWVRYCAHQERQGLGLELFAMSEEERSRWNAYYLKCFWEARGMRQAA